MKLLIFGGTFEGRRLAALLCANGMEVTLWVATEYGKGVAETYPDITPNVRVMAQRLSRAEMMKLIADGGYERVIDATHPYAETATENIKRACFETGVEYMRLIRLSHKEDADSDVIRADSFDCAADILKNTVGNVLLTVGSKELTAFTRIENYAQRMFVRILPMVGSIEKAVGLGYKNSNIICMQGPFGIDMNVAVLKMCGAEYMVTKNSGDEGGYRQKLEAAKRVGCKAVVIKAPDGEDGYTFDEITRQLGVERVHAGETCYAPNREWGKPPAVACEFGFKYFPLFINFDKKSAVVVGGGKVAERRVTALRGRGADITVVSPRLSGLLNGYAQSGEIRHINRKYESGDIKGAFLAVAACDDSEVNAAVKSEADKIGCLAVISDNRGESGCYFPAIIENDRFIAAMVSKTGEHRLLKEKARELRWYLNGRDNKGGKP